MAFFYPQVVFKALVAPSSDLKWKLVNCPKNKNNKNNNKNNNNNNNADHFMTCVGPQVKSSNRDKSSLVCQKEPEEKLFVSLSESQLVVRRYIQ